MESITVAHGIVMPHILRALHIEEGLRDIEQKSGIPSSACTNLNSSNWACKARDFVQGPSLCIALDTLVGA